ncbi:MAG TPA: MnhB domain-containing protein [Terriglobia bacterium]|nr:MnhB domain-containing protein [Terriglobia bacterium]
MSPKVRTRLFFIFGLGFLALFLWALRDLPPSGSQIGSYAQTLDTISVPERHITDVVTAVNFDFRGFDTMGEEYILFTSVMGILLLLRKQRDEAVGEPREKAPERKVLSSSDAVRVVALGLTAPCLLFGIYTITHGQVSPGGGFQGGVILATALLFVFLAGDYEMFSRINAYQKVEIAEAFGAAGYILIGLAAVILGQPFLKNVLPLAKSGTILSGGTVPLINLSVGIEVGSGILLLATAFLEETLVLMAKKRR